MEAQRFYKFLTFSPYSRMSLYMLGKHRAVFFSDSNNLNDPLDCRTIMYSNLDDADSLKLIEENREKLLRDNDILINYNRKHLEYFDNYKQELDASPDNFTLVTQPIRPNDLLQDLARAVVGRAKVFSMSDNCNSPHLWAHYADSHKGFCLEFEFNGPVTTKFPLEKIKYSEEIPAISSIDIFKYYNSSRKPRNMTIKLYCTKSKHWSFENEYRILYLSMKNPSETIFSVPEGIYVRNENLKLRSVIFGIKSNKNDINTVKDILKQYDVKDVNFYKSTGFDNKYNVLKKLHPEK